VAVLGVLTYYCLAIGLFMGLLHVRGYTSWDSTVLHFPTEQVVYLLDGALPALVVAHLLSRTFHFAFLVTPDDEPTKSQPAAARAADVDSESVYSDDDDRDSADPTPSRQCRRTERRPEPPNRWNVSTFCARLGSVVSEYVRCLFLGHSPIYSDLSMIYLIKVYVLSFAIVTHLLLACVQARVYTFMLPQLLLVRFDIEDTWTFRFQLLTLQLISLCLLAGASFAIRLWPSLGLGEAHCDRLYALAILKHERWSGASAKSDDVIAMLEEETEGLIQAQYQPVSRDHHIHYDWE